MKGQKKIKAKKLRNHAPNSAKAYSWMKYDRNFVHDHMADVSTLPMSRGSRGRGFILSRMNTLTDVCIDILTGSWKSR